MPRINNPLHNAMAEMAIDDGGSTIDDNGEPAVVEIGASPVSALVLVSASSTAAVDAEASSALGRLLRHPAVTAVELALIVATIGTLAVDSPYEPPSAGQRQVITVVELLSSAIWTVFLIGNIALGGWHRYVYDDDNRRTHYFNVLDVVVVAGSWLSYVPWIGEHGGRLIRLLRLVRLIPVMRGQASSLRMILDSLFWSLPMLRDVMIFIVFVLFTYSIILLHMLEATMSYRCAVAAVPENTTDFLACESVLTMNDCHPPACAWNGLRGCVDNVLAEAETIECPSTIECAGGNTACVRIPALLVADKVRRRPRRRLARVRIFAR